MLLHDVISAQTIAESGTKKEYIKQAKAQFDINNWEKGKEIVDEGLKKYPKDTDLKMFSGKYYLHHKQYDKARYELNKSLEYNPNNIDTKQVLVSVEMESGRYSSAICYINELLEINPYQRELWRKKIDLYELQDNTIEANRLRKRINQIYLEDDSLQNDFLYHKEVEANAKRKDGKIDEAISLSKELILSKPDNAEYHLYLINDYLKIGDWNNALIYTERGLNLFPGDLSFTDKKTGVLAEQKRYSELLSFLQQQIKKDNSGMLQQQYNHYLLEAARNAQSNTPGNLYRKILTHDPANREAFSHVFNAALADQQYEEALELLKKFQSATGESKDLLMKELLIYKRMKNMARTASLTKYLFEKYPEDIDLKESYTNLLLDEAKEKMNEKKYEEAIGVWQLIGQYGDSEIKKIAQNALYAAYMSSGNYDSALAILNQIADPGMNDPDLYVKKAGIYQKKKRYRMALSTYEKAIKAAGNDRKSKYTGGFGDMLTAIVKELNEQYLYDDAMHYVKRWLEYDPTNLEALRYAINLAHIRKNRDEVLLFTQKAITAYPDHIFFKIKLVEAEASNPEEYAKNHTFLYKELKKSAYHPDLINAFVQLSEDYSRYLIKNKENEKAIIVIDTALYYSPLNRSLKYTKGVAYEKIRNYDSAYYYQKYYEPSPVEISSFKRHLNYLKNKSYNNEIGLYFQYYRQRNNAGNYVHRTVTTVEYSRFQDSNTFTGRVNYAKSGTNDGIQFQTEWSKEWNNVRTRIDAAWANRLFPEIVVNSSVYLDLFSRLEGELGLGYRRLPDRQDMVNLVAGAAKELDLWRINLRFNNFLLENRWLYNLALATRYYFSTPKNYMTLMGSIGSSPDVDVINYRFYDGFSVLNTMVGTGIGHMITPVTSLGLSGTWYHYKVNSMRSNNLYNIHFNINVVF